MQRNREPGHCPCAAPSASPLPLHHLYHTCARVLSVTNSQPCRQRDITSRQPAAAPEVGRIHTLKLARNRLASVSDLEHLRALINLSVLTLDGNPLAEQEHTRSYAIFRLRSLDTLDTSGITAGEPNLIYPNLSNLI